MLVRVSRVALVLAVWLAGVAAGNGGRDGELRDDAIGEIVSAELIECAESVEILFALQSPARRFSAGYHPGRGLLLQIPRHVPGPLITELEADKSLVSRVAFKVVVRRGQPETQIRIHTRTDFSFTVVPRSPGLLVRLWANGTQSSAGLEQPKLCSSLREVERLAITLEAASRDIRTLRGRLASIEVAEADLEISPPEAMYAEEAEAAQEVTTIVWYCGNHSPRHSATTKKDRERKTKKHGCRKWSTR